MTRKELEALAKKYLIESSSQENIQKQRLFQSSDERAYIQGALDMRDAIVMRLELLTSVWSPTTVVVAVLSDIKAMGERNE